MKQNHEHTVNTIIRIAAVVLVLILKILVFILHVFYHLSLSVFSLYFLSYLINVSRAGKISTGFSTVLVDVS